MQLQEVQPRELRPRRRAKTIDTRCNQSVGELLHQMRSRFDQMIQAQREQDELELHDGWQPIRPRAHGGTR